MHLSVFFAGGRRRRHEILVLLGGAAIAALMSCGGGGDATDAPAPRVASTLAVKSGDRQDGVVGTALPAPVVFIAADAIGQPVPGLIVNFAVTSGGGRVTQTADTSDASGQVSTQWTMGTTANAPQELSATSTTPGGATLSARVSASAAAGAPAAIALTPNALDVTAYAAGPKLTARVNDAWNNAVVGATIDFSIESIGVFGHAVTDSTGVATLASWMAPASGSYRIVASVAGSSLASHATLVTRIGTADRIVPTPGTPTTGTAGLEMTLSASVVDAGGTPLPNQPIAWGNGEAGTGQTTSDAQGIAQLKLRLRQKAGPNAVTLTSDNGRVSSTVTVLGVAGPAAHLKALADTLSAPAGSVQYLLFRATDQFDNPIAGAFPTATGWYGLTYNTAYPTNEDGIGTLMVTLDTVASTGYVNALVGFAVGPNLVTATTRIYVTASRGTLRHAETPCPTSIRVVNASVIAFPTVFAANGHYAVNVPVTFSVASGNGTIRLDNGTQVSTAVIPTSTGGQAYATWMLPAVLGTYTMTIRTPAGYDAFSPGTISCTVNP